MTSLLQNSFVRVSLGLIVGLGVILYFYPPKTVCTEQIEVYTEAVRGLAKSASKALGVCKEHPEPGGCVGFFDALDKLEGRFNEVSRQCQAELINEPLTKNWITTGMELFTLVAWGSHPPASYLYRNGWLELTQVVEFCRLRRHLETIYGKEAWTNFVNGILPDLPGAADLSNIGQNEAWNRSLLSDPCQYPF